MSVVVKRLKQLVGEDKRAARVRPIRILGMDCMRRRSRLSALLVSFGLFCELVEYKFARRRSDNFPVLVLPEDILHPHANSENDILEEYPKRMLMADCTDFNMR